MEIMVWKFPKKYIVIIYHTSMLKIEKIILYALLCVFFLCYSACVRLTSELKKKKNLCVTLISYLTFHIINYKISGQNVAI